MAAILLFVRCSGVVPRLLSALGSNPAADLTNYNTLSATHGLVAALIMNRVGMSAVLASTF